MKLIKTGAVKKLLHDAGIKRVSPTALEILDDALALTIETIAIDAQKVFPDQLIESADLATLSKVKDGYKLIIHGKANDVMTMKDLLKGEELPEGLDDEPGEPPKKS